MLAVACGLLPVLIWMVFNYYRLGLLTLTIFSGHSTYTMGSVLGPAYILPTDPPEFVEFADRINQNRASASIDELAIHSAENDGRLAAATHHNEKITLVIGEELRLDPITHDNFEGLFGQRAILGHLRRLLILLRSGIEFMSDTWILVGLLGAIIWLSRTQVESRGLSFGSLSLLIVHLLHMGLVMCSQPAPWSRYYSLTFAPLFFATIVLILYWCKTVLSKDREDAN
jgi:hypothetical protein